MGSNSTEIVKSDVLRQMHMTLDKRPSATGPGTPFYALYLIDVEKGRVVREFGFDVAPQSIRVQENASVDLVATQEGGYWLDERGQYFKQVSVSGTFGFRPSPAIGSSAPQANGARRSTAQQQGSPTNRQTVVSATALLRERTGIDRYIDLQNLFHFYWDQKGNYSTAASLVMVWANWKMGEIYLCSPVNFGMDRNAPSGKFKVAWNFSLKTLTSLNAVAKPRDFLPSPTRKQDRNSLAGSLRSTLGGLEDRISQVERFTNQALDLAGSLQKSVIEPIIAAIDSAKKILDQVSATVENGLNSLAEIPLNALRDVHRALLGAAAVADAVLTLPEKLANQAETLGRLMKGIARDVRTMFVSMSSLLTSDVNSSARAYAGKYRRSDIKSTRSLDGVPISQTRTGDNGTKTAIGSQMIPTGQQAIQLPAGASLKTLAMEYLGSAGRFKELILLNGLKAPYISPNGDGVQVLRPGRDTILLPIEPDSGGDVNQVYASRDDLRNADRYRYGTDLAVDESTFDLFADSGGDLATISGIPNLRQATRVKVATEPGGLRLHPWFGFGPSIGEGLTLDVLSRMYLNFRSTLLSDSRVASVSNLSMFQEGDFLLVRADILPKDSDDAQSLDFRSRLR